MDAILDKLLGISLIIFMVGNLLGMGLTLKLTEAFAGLRDVRFVLFSLLWGFVLCPASAVGLTMLIPLKEPYAMGMILLGMVPCAPFLPAMTEKAKGDMGYAAAFMLLILPATVVYMPLAVPVMVKGLTADAWTIAKPLLFFILVPLIAGMAFHRLSADKATGLAPIVKKITGVDTILMLVLSIVIYYRGFAEAVGTYAIGTQILFFTIAIVASYALSFGLPRTQRSVISLGMATRNIGAALAPLLAVTGVDKRAIIMVVMGVPMQTLAAAIAARRFSRLASPKK